MKFKCEECGKMRHVNFKRRLYDQDGNEHIVCQDCALKIAAEKAGGRERGRNANLLGILESLDRHLQG